MIRGLSMWACLFLLSGPAAAADGEPPKVGDQAPDFELKTVDGKSLTLSKLSSEGPVVLLVLRGFPGYQCPLCRRQTAQFKKEADAFREAGANVVMVYPGDVDDLNAKALQFLGTKKLPEGFHMVLDPGYEFTNSWNLRWEGPNETAYPSTFVIGKDQKVKFAKVSKTHGGRTSPDVVLDAVKGS